MSIKRIFIAMTAIFAASAVFADNSSVTSKKYVDDLMSGYQGKLPGSGANKLMIYDDEDGIGEKSIETTLGSGATGVPTVGAVKTGLDGKQDTITGTAGYVMTGTGNPGEVGEKPIYSTTNNYTDALVTAEMVNTGVTNAVNSSLIRVDTSGNPSDSGTLWEINTDLFALDVQPLLPNGYTRLLYIESTGTQYIDTGQALDTSTDDIELVFQPTKIVAENGNNIFGARNTTSSNAYTFALSAGSYYRLGWGNSTITAGLMGDTNKHTLRIEHNGGVFKLDGNVISELGNVAITTPNNATLFVVWNPSRTYAGYAKIYEYKKWRNGELVQHFVPARNSSGVLGMYDLADTNPATAFHAKAGSGDFIAGPAVGN